MYRLRSLPAAVAAQCIAVRGGAASGSVILAALSMALRETLVLPPHILQLVTGNRHYADLADYVGIAIENGPFVVPDGDHQHGFVPFTQRCHAAAMSAFKNARYDNFQLRAFYAEQAAAGTAPDLSYLVNDARRPGRWDGLERQAEILSGWTSAESAVDIIERRHVQDSSLFFGLPDDAADPRFVVVCDDNVVTADMATAILKSMEATLIAAADDD